MIINDMITQGDFSWVVLIFLVTSPWLLYVYAKTIGTRWENLFFDISGERVNPLTPTSATYRFYSV